MQSFKEIRENEIQGRLTIFDRVIFKGHMRSFHIDRAFERFLSRQNVLLMEYGKYAEEMTRRLSAHAKSMASELGRPYVFIHSPNQSKEKMARFIAERDEIETGLVCVLGAVEPCKAFTVRGNGKTKKKELVYEYRKCTHFYFYYIDEEFGWMHVRLQSWLPFSIQVYISGHEYVARQLSAQGIGYQEYDNTFIQVDDLAAAQKLCDKFAHRKWAPVLNAFARRHNPLLDELQAAGIHEYYWVVNASEIATDLIFNTQKRLDDLLPELFQESILTFNAKDVMRFLGKKLHGNYKGEIVHSLNERPEGWRVKHSAKTNSIKMYNKCNVLRIETTINNSREFRMPADNQRRWKPLNKSVGNFWRLYQIGKEANQRYLDALDNASIQDGEAVQALDCLCRSQTSESGKRIAKFNPVTLDDCSLFAAVLSSQHCIHGFRNKDICASLFHTESASPHDAKRLSARVSRLIAKLRGHGLVEKVGNSRLYRATAYGIKVMSTAIHYRFIDFPQAFHPA